MENFSYITSDGAFDPKKYLSVLEGENAVYLAKGAMDKTHCPPVLDAFLRHPALKRYGTNHVVYAIGHGLYTARNPEIGEYFEHADEHQKAINEVFVHTGVPNYVEKTLQEIRASLNRLGITFRKVQHEGREGFAGLMRGWGLEGSDSEGRVIRVHEDRLYLQHQKVDCITVKFPF